MADDRNTVVALAVPFDFGNDCSAAMVSDEAALQQNLRTLCTVKRGEVLLNTEFGNRLGGHLFDMNDSVMWMALDATIRDAVAKWEPKVQVMEIRCRRNDRNPEQVLVRVWWRSRLTPQSPVHATTVVFPYGVPS